MFSLPQEIRLEDNTMILIFLASDHTWVELYIVMKNYGVVIFSSLCSH